MGGKMRECQQSGCYQQHYADNQQARTEDFLDRILEKETHDGHRNHRDEDVDGIFRAAVEVFI